MPKYQKNNPELVKEKKDYLKERAIGYIALRERSVKEIWDYLQKKAGFFPGIITEKEISEIIAELKEENLLSDTRFVSWWVESRGYFRPKSKIVLIQELRQKGISNDDIVMYFENNDHDELQLAIKIVSKKINKYEKFDNKQKFQKIVSQLMRMGFSYQIAKSAFEEFTK